MIGLLLMLAVEGRAGEPLLMKDVFKAMPDSLIPYLSANNKLDMIDFMESGMKAEVDNMLGGKSEMKSLSADSLTLQLSAGLKTAMFLLKPLEPVDSCSQIVCLIQTFGADTLSYATKIEYFTPNWQPISLIPRLSEADRLRIERLNVQTILKWEERILKKD